MYLCNTYRFDLPAASAAMGRALELRRLCPASFQINATCRGWRFFIDREKVCRGRESVAMQVDRLYAQCLALQDG